jgi:hypothetical protein
MYRVRRVSVWILGAIVVLGARIAGATPPPVHLSVESCESLDEASVRRIFTADLGSPTTVEVGKEITEVTVSCEGERVVVRVKDPLSRKTVKRSFDRHSFGNQAESRVIAIAASELVFASWAELEANPTPKVLGEGEPAKPEALANARGVVRERTPPPSAKPSPLTLDGPGSRDETADTEEERQAAAERASARRQATEARRARTRTRDAAPAEDRGAAPEDESVVLKRATAVLSIRHLLRGDGTLFGGGARLGHERWGVVSWSLDTLVESGQLRAHNVTSASVGGALQFYARVGPATFRLGGGLRAGVVSLVGGGSVAAWGWPMLVTCHSVRAGPVVLDLAGEAGFVDLLLLRNQSVRGPWASGQLGVGVVL